MAPVGTGFCLQRCVAGAFCALLLLSGTSRPASTPGEKPLTAILIIARNALPDSMFADSIVLVMNNLGPAPVGIIINRPMPISVPGLFPDLQRLAPVRDRVYFGGPVDFGAVWFVFRATTPPEHAIQFLTRLPERRPAVAAQAAWPRQAHGRSADLRRPCRLGAGAARGRDRSARLDAKTRRGRRDLQRQVRAPLARAAGPRAQHLAARAISQVGCASSCDFCARFSLRQRYRASNGSAVVRIAWGSWRAW